MLVCVTKMHGVCVLLISPKRESVRERADPPVHHDRKGRAACAESVSMCQPLIMSKTGTVLPVAVRIDKPNVHLEMGERGRSAVRVKRQVSPDACSELAK